MECGLLAGLIALSFASCPAAAQSTSMRTFVSGVGTDSGACARTAPCRSFQYAYGVTPAGGEVVALDPAGYGTLTISHAISIIGPDTGAAAITVAAGGTGVAINAPGAAVSLRGIELDGGGDITSTAIALTNVGSLNLRDMVVTRVGNGLVSKAAVNVTVTNSAFVHNRRALQLVAALQQGAGGQTLLDHVEITGNGTGLNASGATQVVDCTFASQTTAAFAQYNGTAVVKGSVFTGNPVGIGVLAGATLAIDTTTVTGNNVGINNDGGTVNSYGDNNIVANNTNVAGAITKVTPN